MKCNIVVLFFDFYCSRLKMIFNQPQLSVQTKSSQGSQHLLLVRRMPLWATWHTMVSLLDGQIMKLEGTQSAEHFF